MKPRIALLTVLLAMALVMPVTVAEFTTDVDIEVRYAIGPDQPLSNMTIYIIRSGEDTTRVLVQNRTDSNGRAVFGFNLTSDKYHEILWVIATDPVVIIDLVVVEMDVGGNSISRYYLLNDTSWYCCKVTITAVLDQLPGTSVKGNLTVWYYLEYVRIVHIPLALKDIYFMSEFYPSATLYVPKTVTEGGTTYSFVNMTIYFKDGGKTTHDSTTYEMNPLTVDRVVIHYSSAPATEEPEEEPGIQPTFWIAMGVLLAAAAGFVALARTRRAAMAILRERRVLRALPLRIGPV